MLIINCSDDNVFMNSYSLQRDVLFDDGCQIYQIESEKDGVCLKYWILAKERIDEFELRISYNFV